jgi:hypothetical protein
MSNAEIEFSVVIPVYNEEASLDELVKRCHAPAKAPGRIRDRLIDDGCPTSWQMIATTPRPPRAASSGSSSPPTSGSTPRYRRIATPGANT